MDEYSNLSLKDEVVRFENLFITLKNNPYMKAYISFEIRKEEKVENVEKRLAKIFNFLKQRKYDVNRIVYDVCKSDRNETTMWLILPNDFEMFRPENCEKIDINFKSKSKN